ncbi:MAG: hypothetical protein GF383_10150, partial [Candidatus Lokiarchaeota archaeon]|nr:hypothetical protein [Candidatus Lokiarchaeota archaeon]
MPYYIAFDLSHKPRGKIDENYTELRDHLNSNGFVCYNLLETPITQISLRPFDILVFICPDFAKISSQEVNEIQNWVKEDGGGLLMLSHAGGDKGRNSNLGDLSQQFGISFENDQVLDEVNNIGMENMPIISNENFKPPHPITDNIEFICYRAGCSLTVIGNAISIISSNESSEPFFTPLVCTAEPDKGRVCAIGSYEMFRDKTGGGYQYDNHADLALNIFNWLVTDYRMELRSEEGKAAPTPEEGQTEGDEDNSCVSPVYNAPKNQSVEYKEVGGLENLNISSKSELLELLNFFLTQLNTVKFTVENLIKAVQENKGDLFSFSTDETSLKTTDYERYAYDKEQYSDYSEETYQNEQYSYDYASEEHPNSFTSLPPKPSRYE